MGTGTHSCSHACCSAVPYTFTHIFAICPVAGAVVAWVSATWGALPGEAGPPHSAELLLADDRPAKPLQGLWQRLRLPTLTYLLAAHRAAQQTARVVAARTLGARAGRPPARLPTDGRGAAQGRPFVLSVVQEGPAADQRSLLEWWCHRGGKCARCPRRAWGEPLIRWTTAPSVPVGGGMLSQ